MSVPFASTVTVTTPLGLVAPSPHLLDPVLQLPVPRRVALKPGHPLVESALDVDGITHEQVPWQAFPHRRYSPNRPRCGPILTREGYSASVVTI